MDPKLRLIVNLLAGLVGQAETVSALIDLIADEVTDAEVQELRTAADDANDELTGLIERLRGGKSG